jgi:uncharacterized membrane-anchored protein
VSNVPQYLSLASNIYCVNAFVTYGLLSGLSGGLSSPFSFGFALAPVISMLDSGWRNATFWVVAEFLFFILLWLADICGLCMPPLPRDHHLILQFLHNCIFGMVLFGVVLTYQRVLDAALMAKDEQARLLNGSLQQKKDFLAHVAHEV